MALYLSRDPAMIGTKGQMDERLLDAINAWFVRRRRAPPIHGGWYNMLAAHDATFNTYKLQRNRQRMLHVLHVMLAIWAKEQ